MKIKYFHKPKSSSQKGFSLLEITISILIISFLVVTIFALYSYSLKLVSEDKYKTQAITLAEQKMELLKNLPYNDLGTVGGIPSGTILQNENVIFNGASYAVHTQIIYYDDSADGILGINPSELSGTDYKKLKIKISWAGPFGNKDISIISNISPKRNQSADNTGTLSILVFNASGQPVPQADVTINAAVGTTTINISAQTNNSGKLIYPGAPAAQNAYAITASKTGYSTDTTCKIDASGSACTSAQGNPNPTKSHASVISGALTEISFAIDLLSTMIVKTIRQAAPTEWIINTDTTAYDQDNPSMNVCNNGNYIFIWRDFRQNNNPRIYAQMYDVNFNKLWTPDLAVTTSNNQNNPDVVSDKNCNTYVTWNDDRNGNQDIYYEKFNTIPVSEWSGSKKVNTSAESADQSLPQIVFGTTPPFAYIAWLDSRDGSHDIYSQKINPNTGALSWSPEVKVNMYNGSAPIQNKPKIYIDSSDNLNFAWQDNRNGHNDIFAQKMDKNGNILWSNDIKINSDTTTTDQTKPSFTVSSTTPSFLYFVWEDNRNGNKDIYAQKYDPSGAKIWTNDIKINSDTGSAIQENPVITEDNNGDFYIVWQDNRNGNDDTYMQKINSDGTKQIAFDVRINNITTNDQENPDIYINQAGYLVIVWQDNNDGDYDIKAAVYGSDPETITNIANVPLVIRGAKRIGENPVIYKYNQNFTTNASGDLTISNLEWDQYTITPTGFTVLRSEPAQPVPVNANQTVSVFLNLQ